MCARDSLFEWLFMQSFSVLRIRRCYVCLLILSLFILKPKYSDRACLRYSKVIFGSAAGIDGVSTWYRLARLRSWPTVSFALPPQVAFSSRMLFAWWWPLYRCWLWRSLSVSSWTRGGLPPGISAPYSAVSFLHNSYLTLPLPSSKSTFSQRFKKKCISEVVRIGSMIIFHLSKLWKAKFFSLCDVIFLVRLQGKLKLIWPTLEWEGLPESEQRFQKSKCSSMAERKFLFCHRKRSIVLFEIFFFENGDFFLRIEEQSASTPRGVLPYISHIGMCRPKGYHFRAFLVWNRV